MQDEARVCTSLGLCWVVQVFAVSFRPFRFVLGTLAFPEVSTALLFLPKLAHSEQCSHVSLEQPEKCDPSGLQTYGHDPSGDKVMGGRYSSEKADA